MPTFLRTSLVVLSLLAAALAGCGDEDAAPPSQSDGGTNAAADGLGALQDGTAAGDGAAVDTEDQSDSGGAEADASPDVNFAGDGAVVDVGGAEDAGSDAGDEDVSLLDAGAADVAAADADSPDAGGADTDAVDAGGDATSGDGGGADAGGAKNPCPTCLVDKQPAKDHPGGKGACGVLSPKEIAYGSGFGQGYKKMIAYRPSCAGGHPVLFFVHEKGIYNAGGIFGKLGEGYRKMMEHVASHGAIAVFVRVETGLLDGDHDRMADDLLAATKKLFTDVSVAVDSEVVFAGHGMGAKVATLAAVKTLAKDGKNAWVDPRAVIAFGIDNQKSLLTSSYTDVSLSVKQIAATSDVTFTFVEANDDEKAPYNDPKKPNALAIYENLSIARKQIIVLHGTGKGDSNPPSSPELHDDHSAPLTVVGKPGGATDLTNKASYLDALDWYGYWKITVGAIDFHFNQGDKKWAYGAMRSHGGTLPSGKIVTHEVFKEQWK